MSSSDLDAEVSPDPGVPEPDWWHRDHPTFAALAGYFTGLLFVLLVPALYVGSIGLIAGRERAEELFPFLTLVLVVPIGLVAWPRTRRFGAYMWLGIVTTALVVVGVAALVLWILVSNES